MTCISIRLLYWSSKLLHVPVENNSNVKRFLNLNSNYTLKLGYARENDFMFKQIGHHIDYIQSKFYAIFRNVEKLMQFASH